MSGWAGPDLSPLVVHRHTDDLSDIRRWLLRRAETEKVQDPADRDGVGDVGNDLERATDQGVHTVDLLLWLLGDVTRVQARTATLLHEIESEDTAVALLEFEGGAVGVLEATTAAYPGYPRRVELTGTEGTVVLEHDRIVAADLRASRPDLLTAEGDRNPSASSPVVSDASGHQRLIEDFLRAIETGSRPACDGYEGRRSVELVEAIYRSARSLASEPVGRGGTGAGPAEPRPATHFRYRVTLLDPFWPLAAGSPSPMTSPRPISGPEDRPLCLPCYLPKVFCGHREAMPNSPAVVRSGPKASLWA